MPKRIAQTISLTELFRRFPTEAHCVKWLEAARWSGKPVCPHCGGMDNLSQPKSKPFHYWHKDCRKFFTVKTGTAMHSSKTPTQNWMVAIYLVMTARKGVSSMQLSKELGVQQKTAWYMLQRIREACRRGDFKLANVVEADETYIGGKESSKHDAKKLKAGRGAVGKTPVAGVRERGGKVVAKPVKRTDAATLINFVEANVAPGATVNTDEAGAYQGLPTLINGFRHETVKHGEGEYVRGEAHTNGMESVWAVFKRSVQGTWHHVSPKHLARYVNEAAFRLNDGNCEVDTLDRMLRFAQGIGGKRIAYAELTA